MIVGEHNLKIRSLTTDKIFIEHKFRVRVQLFIKRANRDLRSLSPLKEKYKERECGWKISLS